MYWWNKNIQNLGFLRKNPWKSLTQLSAQPGVSQGSVHTAMMLWKSWPHEITVIQRLINPNSGTRIGFCNWLLGSMHDGIYAQTCSFLVIKHGCIQAAMSTLRTATSVQKIHISHMNIVFIILWLEYGMQLPPGHSFLMRPYIHNVI
jgi:hypothetical protein